MATRRKTIPTNWYEVLMMLVGLGVIPGKWNRVLLYGLPGTGKSSAAYHLFPDQSVVSVTLYPSQPEDSLTGAIGLRGDRKGGTDTICTPGIAAQQMIAGAPLVIDEIDHRSPDVESMLYGILDDGPRASLLLPDGSRVKPAPGYCIFATTNQLPSVLPAPIQDRFDLILAANEPAPGILADLPEDVQGYITRDCAVKARGIKPWSPAPSPRTFRRAESVVDTIPREQSYPLVFGPVGVDILAALATSGKGAGAK